LSEWTAGKWNAIAICFVCWMDCVCTTAAQTRVQMQQLPNLQNCPARLAIQSGLHLSSSL
jgi:hypothetical protein